MNGAITLNHLKRKNSRKKVDHITAKMKIRRDFTARKTRRKNA